MSKRDTVYIVEMSNYDSGWVAGVYASEAEAREAAAKASLDSLSRQLEWERTSSWSGADGYGSSDAASVLTAEIGADVKAQWPGASEPFARYLWGMDVDSAEFKEAYCARYPERCK